MGAPMKVFVFKSTTQPKLYGFTRSSVGASLPEQSGPWNRFGAVELNPDDGLYYGVKSALILMAIHDNGYHLTELKFD